MAITDTREARLCQNSQHQIWVKIWRNLVAQYFSGFFSRIPEDCARLPCVHYSGVIMGAMASQITSLTIVYSTVYSGADQRKHQSSASLAFVRGIHRWPVNSPHKWPVNREMFPLDDIIMIRNCFDIIVLWLLRSMFAGTFPLLVWCRHFSKIKSIGRQHAAVLTIQSTQIDTTSGNWRTSSCGLSTPPRMRPGWTSIRHKHRSTDVPSESMVYLWYEERI